MGENDKAKPQTAGTPDNELPIAGDPSLSFWKTNAKNLLGESIKSLEEAAKQIIGVAGILEGLYFHAVTYANVRGKLTPFTLLIYLAPIAFWLASLTLALLVFFPRAYDTNINSAKASRLAFEEVVAYKHGMLKAAGVALALGSLALAATMGVYLAG